ncbi:hypothetical protein [Methylocystis bryophila]|uniref:Uncharacterized protein n=1 Tax=Methylocystis bryophila TaxID=655015 RepID=A0A1W6MZS9_9HYPH|nr:hypothetical protein [Methylocystis bryophila]ARN83087.1 hypothetical protein B1812_20625 [Methylocystis bryophila]BDV39401.1 hypothetical protein DSM21852_26540 [Methylocystis bryophila]
MRSVLRYGIGVPFCLILLGASPLAANPIYVLIGVPLLLLLWALVAARSLILCVRFAARGLWKSSLACAALPVAAVLVCLYPTIFLRSCAVLGDVLHFVVALPYYERVVAGLPRNESPRIAVFNWGGMVWNSRGVVYDESDEVALPAGEQSVAWRASAHLGELQCGGFSAQPLWRHYYLVSFPC